MAIEAQELEIQIGARTLLHPTNFHVAKGDKIGLVGRNGAGKTTLTRVITGDMLPTAGKVRVSGKLGYLPQDTHAADPEQTALDRMMSARDIASIIMRIRKAEKEMTDPDPDVMTRAMNRYDKAMQDFEKAGGYAAQSEATAMAASLGLPQEGMGQQLGTLSGGQRRRIELARILFSDADTLILDEPTNHLDMRSKDVLKEAIRDFDGTVIIVSHDRDFLDGLATKVYEFGGGLVKEHLGGIYDFLQKKQIESLNDLQKSPSLSFSPSAEKTVAGGNAGATVAQPSAAKLSYEEQKELNKRLKKLERRVADCEAEIEQTEAAISILEAKMATPEGASDMALYEQHQKLKAQLDSVMEEWDAVSCELEEARK